MINRLVESGWSAEFADALRADSRELRIVSPFIKVAALQRLLAARPSRLQVITRFNLVEFADGVSDIAALRRMLAAGGKVRGVKNLHAKIYLFGSARVIVTSANLTEAALNRNHEFGLVSEDPEIIAVCRQYFDDIWKCGGPDLESEQLDQWETKIAHHRAAGGRPGRVAGLGDFGADARVVAPPLKVLPTAVAEAPQAFVKFLGEGHNRVPLEFSTFTEIERAGCHWALAYPASKRPSGVKDDALMFIARLTKDPNDIRIFGRAVGMRHLPGRDDATPEDIARREWKATWSRYIRVHHAEFVAGTMANGVSLNELKNEFGPRSFASTQRNAAQRSGNTDPHKAYNQQPAVELTAEACAWLGERLQAAFDMYGKIPQVELDKLDWPEVPE